MRTKGWFGPRQLGNGIGPRSWQGWLVCAAAAIVAAGNHALPYAQWGWPGWAHAATGFGAVAVLLLVAWTTYSAD